MSINRMDIVTVDLDKCDVYRRGFRRLGRGDVDALTVGVDVLRSGTPVNLATEDVDLVGYFRNREEDIKLGTAAIISGNRATLTLPEACAALAGPFTLALKLEDGTAAVTVRVIDGEVLDIATETVSGSGDTGIGGDSSEVVVNG